MAQLLSIAYSITSGFRSFPSAFVYMGQIQSLRLGQVMLPAGKPILLGQFTDEFRFDTVL